MEWSPSGRHLLFRTDGGDGNGRLQIADVTADSSIVSQSLLPDSLQGSLRTFQNFHAGGPRWSPNGEHVAFLAVPPDETSLEVYVADAVEQRVVRWTQSESTKWSVEWLRDGTRLLYTTGSSTGSSGTVKSPARSINIGGRPSVEHADNVAFLRDLLRSPSGDYLLARTRSRPPVLLEANSGDSTEVTSHGLPNRDYKGWSDGGDHLLADRAREMSSGLEAVHAPSGSKTTLSSSTEHHTLMEVGHISPPTTRLLYRSGSGSSSSSTSCGLATRPRAPRKPQIEHLRGADGLRCAGQSQDTQLPGRKERYASGLALSPSGIGGRRSPVFGCRYPPW